MKDTLDMEVKLNEDGKKVARLAHLHGDGHVSICREPSPLASCSQLGVPGCGPSQQLSLVRYGHHAQNSPRKAVDFGHSSLQPLIVD